MPTLPSLTECQVTLNHVTMPYTDEHKQRSRQKILISTLALFTRKGFDNVTINEIMANADLTRGAFYAHFKSKSELYSEVVLLTAVNNAGTEQNNLKESNGAVLKALVLGYLSQSHVNQGRRACPLAFMALLIGGVAVGRALNDDLTVERLLSACRNQAEQMIE